VQVSPSSWIPLADATNPERFGSKAATLARLLGEGLPVVPGWVLPVGTPPDVAPLLEHPVTRWILRSSSPLEDRPGFSAAGLFLSQSSGASTGELRRALRAVLDSADDPRLAQLLGTEPTIAVLAQPHLEFGTWCTAEVREDGILYEGWTRGGNERFTAEEHPDLDGLVRAAVDVVGFAPLLLELGIAEGQPFVLQARPAPSRKPAPAPEPSATGTPLYPGLGAHVHRGDGAKEWIVDLEHCPTPLSVLLATTFGRWIAADPLHSESRIVDGRWHDAASAPTNPSTAEADWHRWRRQLAERIEPGVRLLTARHDSIDGGFESWRSFHDAWLSLQRDYFAMPTRAARAWAREALGPERRRPGLDQTPTVERLRRWAMLRDQVLKVLPTPTAESIARWVGENPRELLAIVLRKTANFDRRIAPLPYDGFTPGLDEDPWPLYRALASEIRIPVGEPAANDLASAILALAESDNDLLLETYALWRSAIRRIGATRAVPAPRDLHDLDVESFERWLRAGGDLPEAAAGRALHATWSLAGAETGGILEGRPAAGGQARGPVRLAASLLQIEEGGIAVVETLGPADAIAVPRFDAIVCATGDVLGHASVLCREFGIPCVVGIPGIRQLLARAEEVLVDGDRGLVRDLSPGTKSA
jgi:pyruvate,water dikinase